MIANYHTHTWRCGHAVGTEREYVENAIMGGFKILGFSDHTPMPYDGGYVSKDKMLPDQLEDYVNTILDLKKEYQDDIQIYLGLETEYYPRYFEALLKLTGQFPIEYFILGQHYIHNEIGEPFNARPTADPGRLECYCRQSIEALRTGCFSYFAHPDLLNFTGDPDTYDYWARWLCRGALELKIPLEINFLGIWDHRSYPNPRFWKIAGEVGNEVIFGSDAHQPEKVWNSEALKTAEKMVQEYGLNKIDMLKLRAPRFN